MSRGMYVGQTDEIRLSVSTSTDKDFVLIKDLKDAKFNVDPTTDVGISSEV